MRLVKTVHSHLFSLIFFRPLNAGCQRKTRGSVMAGSALNPSCFARAHFATCISLAHFCVQKLRGCEQSKIGVKYNNQKHNHEVLELRSEGQ